jgi:acetolactate synthase-1/2/3 large subunit
VAQATRTRIGGHVVVECLEALGAGVAFGLPGIHALAIWDGLRESSVRYLGFRTELNAGFAADGYARASGRPAPLLLSTGPGALNSLTAIMEASSAHVPVVAIASQIPTDLIGRGRGYLHELRDQAASFAPLVKWTARAGSADEIPELFSAAWRRAQTPPSGPVFLEIPVDLLTGETDLPAVDELDGIPETPPVPDVIEAVEILRAAVRPVIWAGGGVLRSGAWDEIRELAERLGALVATTYMGKGAFPEDHPLALGSACDEAAFQETIAAADVLLCIGTELGAETTGQYSLRPSGRILQIDADPNRIGATYPALGLVGDAKAILVTILERLPPTEAGEGRSQAGDAKAVHGRIARGLDEQGRELERGLLTAIREALPRDAVGAWDMTILAYWAGAHFPALEPRRFLYPLGSGTLGYAWPASLGAAAATGGPTVAVVGDGGFLYGVAELASARQNGLDVTLLLVDDGGYGILREYQRDAFGETFAVDLAQPDFAALLEAFGIPRQVATPESLADDLRAALAIDGPAAVVLKTYLEMWTPTS